MSVVDFNEQQVHLARLQHDTALEAVLLHYGDHPDPAIALMRWRLLAVIALVFRCHWRIADALKAFRPLERDLESLNAATQSGADALDGEEITVCAEDLWAPLRSWLDDSQRPKRVRQFRWKAFAMLSLRVTSEWSLADIGKPWGQNKSRAYTSIQTIRDQIAERFNVDGDIVIPRDQGT